MIETPLKGMPWRATVNQGYGTCCAYTIAAERCTRQGPYGWKNERFCYQHHPNWSVWLAESLRLEKIAQAAVDRETGGPQ